MNKFALAALLFWFALLAWNDLPPVRAPYSPTYWLNRAFYQPTALCADGVYSFAVNDSGRCSSHGGVKKEF